MSGGNMETMTTKHEDIHPAWIEEKPVDFEVFVYWQYGISINKESIKFIPDAELKKYEEEWKAYKEKSNG